MLNKLSLTRVGEAPRIQGQVFNQMECECQRKVITVFYEMTELDTIGKSANVGRSYERPMLHLSINSIL